MDGFGSTLEQLEAVCFDCDGVLFRGATVIEGVPATLAALQQRGLRVFYVTNNATKSRLAQRAQKPRSS
jgi:ribonucleotide monophosphatase NagD (HAD superfamily)